MDLQLIKKRKNFNERLKTKANIETKGFSVLILNYNVFGVRRFNQYETEH